MIFKAVIGAQIVLIPPDFLGSEKVVYLLLGEEIRRW